VRKSLLFSTVLFAGLELAAAGIPAQKIVISGADSMILLAQKTAKSFTFSHTGAQIDVTPGGEAKAVQQLTRGVDVAQGVSSVSRSAADRVHLAIGIESSVVVLNKVQHHLGTDSFSAETDLYRQDHQLEGSRRLGCDNSDLQHRVRSGRQPLPARRAAARRRVRYPVARLYQPQRDDRSVAADPRGIGFGPITDAAAVKLPKVSKGKNFVSIDPTMDNIRSARYPLARYMYWSISRNASSLTHQFCEWMVSKDGQLVVESLGYFPLPAEKRQEAMRSLTTANPGQ